MVPEGRLPRVGIGEVEHARGKGAPRQMARPGGTPPTNVRIDGECEMLRKCEAQRWNSPVLDTRTDLVYFILAVLRAVWLIEEAMCLTWCF